MGMKRPWHPCEYVDSHLKHDGTWVDGRWYEWKDRDGNIEFARMEFDVIDHFSPRAEIIKEEDVIAFRELKMANEGTITTNKIKNGSEMTFGGPIKRVIIYVDQHFNWFQKRMFRICFGIVVKDYTEE